jgi:SP family arabinose:H+ symporter-like MFS transporter
MDRIVNRGYLAFLAITGALGGLLFGFDIAIITGAGPFIAHTFALNDLGLGWAFSSLLFGCVLGCFIAGKLTGRHGRKKLLILVAALFALTSIATALAGNFTIFVTARFLGGIAVGGVSLLSPMYVAEVAPPHLRGRMGTLYQLSIITGVIVSYGINYLLRGTGPGNWRWMFLSGVVPSAVFLLLISIAPETPRFLAKAGKADQAFNVLKRISGTASARSELAEIEASISNLASSAKPFGRIGVRRALVASIGLAILVQVSGINTIMDYAPSIFQSAGWKMDGALASTFLVGMTEFVFTILSLWMIDRYGRKPLYIVGSGGMTITLLLLVVAAMGGHFQGSFVLVDILTYLAFFACCVGPVFWTLVPEIFPNDVRGAAMIVPVLIQWVANAVVVLFFPYAFHVIGKASTFGFLALMSLVQGVFTWLCLPETRNRRLEEIEAFWAAPEAVASVEEA